MNSVHHDTGQFPGHEPVRKQNKWTSILVLALSSLTIMTPNTGFAKAKTTDAPNIDSKTQITNTATAPTATTATGDFAFNQTNGADLTKAPLVATNNDVNVPITVFNTTAAGTSNIVFKVNHGVPSVVNNARAISGNTFAYNLGTLKITGIAANTNPATTLTATNIAQGVNDNLTIGTNGANTMTTATNGTLTNTTFTSARTSTAGKNKVTTGEIINGVNTTATAAGGPASFNPSS